MTESNQPSDRSRLRVGILDDFQNAVRRFGDWKALEEIADVTVFHDHLTDEDALAERLSPFDVLLVTRERTPLRASLLQRLPNLRMISSTGPWNASIDLEYARGRGITVCGTEGFSTAAAELTWALIMAAARHLPTEFDAFRNGQWQQTVGLDLHGKTLALLGLGNMGAHVARYGNAFGMEVIAWSQNMTPDIAREHGATYVGKEELFRRGDFVSIHVRLSDRTRGIVDAQALNLMKKTAWLINTARGPVVDGAALIEALDNKRIAGAALDVYDTEPLAADHPYRRRKDIIGTPHIGYVTESSYKLYYGQAIENILAWAAGKPIRMLSADNKASAR